MRFPNPESKVSISGRTPKAAPIAIRLIVSWPNSKDASEPIATPVRR